MNNCSAFHDAVASTTPPAHFTPLRASAYIFAAQAGYEGYSVKVVENTVGIKARIGRGVPSCGAWSVYVRAPGAARGKHIGTMLEHARDAFGPYRYR